jgi:hypothetical protein
MTKLLVLAFALLAMACGSVDNASPALPKPFELQVEPAPAPTLERFSLTIDGASLTPDDQEAVLGAIESWQALAAGRFEIEAVIGDASAHGPFDVYGSTFEELDQFLPEGSPKRAHVLGFTSNDHGVQLISGLRHIRGTAAHELGHVIGLPHNEEDPTAVMWPVNVGLDGATPSDKSALDARFGVVGIVE